LGREFPKHNVNKTVKLVKNTIYCAVVFSTLHSQQQIFITKYINNNIYILRLCSAFSLCKEFLWHLSCSYSLQQAITLQKQGGPPVVKHHLCFI